MSETVTQPETLIFTAVKSVLDGFRLAGTPPGTTVPVVRGIVNRVPQPAAQDHIVMWPLGASRLSTNIDDYLDNFVIGSISENTLTVAEVLRGHVQVGAGMWTSDGDLAGQRIRRQVSGDAGGVGVYLTDPVPDTPSTTIYCGVEAAMNPQELRVQLDVHGPLSWSNAMTIATLVRDYVGVVAFQETGSGVTPLYTEDPRMIPFSNGEDQYEERWVVELCLQVNPVVSVALQFADTLTASSVNVEKTYPP
jgi:hypothetical protein